MSDHSLLPRSEIIQQYWSRMIRAASGYERNEALRDELAQEMAIEVWRALSAFNNQCKLSTYIYRVIHNVAVDYIRRCGRQIKTQASDESFLSEQLSPEQDIVQAQQQSQLVDAIQKLPLSLRQVLLLKLEDLSHNEIANTLGLSETNVAVRLNRAKTQLTKYMHGVSK